MRVKIRPLLFVFFAVCALGITGCADFAEKKEPSLPVSKSGFYFDTYITITLYALDEPTETHIARIFDDCFALATACEGRFSRTLAGSDLWEINHALGKPTAVSPDTAKLLSSALAFAELTEGRVDPSIGAVSSLWDFHVEEGKEGVVPSESAILEALTHVDYRKISVRFAEGAENETQDSTAQTSAEVTLADPDMILDLGFIAKGYIADKMREVLLREGVSSAIVNLGANILTVGAKEEGSAAKKPFLLQGGAKGEKPAAESLPPFQVGIQKPFGKRNETVAVAKVSNASVVSSGNYERYFVADGRLYHHILDTRTGYPVESGLCGVTIFSESSTVGDALSTACFCLGAKEASALIEKTEGVEALFITADGELLTTSGLDIDALSYLR